MPAGDHRLAAVYNTAMRGMTAEDLAAALGVSARAVRKREGIEAYVCGQVPGPGRPRQLYSPDALGLWGMALPVAPEPRQQRGARSDRGQVRGCTPEEWQSLCSIVQGFYMASAQPNLRLACEQAINAVRSAGTEPVLTHQQVYKRLTRRDTVDGIHVSPYYREGWEIVHQSRWRVKVTALGLAKRRFDWQALWEDLGWAGRGMGALRGWSIDVRMGDAWTRGHDGAMHLPAAVYIRDCLTGMPIWVEPVETETADSIIGAMLKAMMAWQRTPDICFVIDNGASMVAQRTMGVLRSLLPASAWDEAARYPELFGAEASPIMHNLPNIPTSPFKAALERSFRLIKDEYDSSRHSLTYQGGSRQEAVQLRVTHRATHEYLPEAVISSTANYFAGLGDWLYSDYVARERPRMFPTLERRGITPSIGAAFQYYYDPRPQLPMGERIAHLLYWASRRRQPVRAQLGYVDATIDGEYWHCLSAKLDHHTYNHPVMVLPIPDTDFAILMLVDDPQRPVYLDTARNGYIRTAEDLREVTPLAREVQGNVRARLREARERIEVRTWETTHPALDVRPALSAEGQRQAAALIDGTVLETEHITDAAEDLPAAGDATLDADIDRHLDEADDIWQ